MKRNVIIIFSFFLCFIYYSCSKEEIEQEGEDNPTIISTGKVISEKTIGIEGGNLQAEGFEVTVPAQTFSAPTKVSITKINDNGFSSNALTEHISSIIFHRMPQGN